MNLWQHTPRGQDDSGPQNQRIAWFSKLVSGGDWKGPIDARILASEFTDCLNAAVWFTGGVITIAERYDDGTIRVQGEGYYYHNRVNGSK